MSRRQSRMDAEPNGRSRASTAGWLLLGLVIGLAGSLYYAWVIDPVVYTDASPARLSDAYQRDYLLLASRSYALTGDWPQTEQRLQALELPDMAGAAGDLLDALIREQQPAQTIRQVAALARELGVERPSVARFAPGTGATVTPTPTATSPLPAAPQTPTPTTPPTGTPAPTATATERPSPTPAANYRLLDQQRVCDDEDAPRIEVNTLDAFLNPLPGVEVLVSWPEGQDRFFTGFKPEISPGYGDFTMQPETSYTVALAEGSPQVSGLRLERCDNGAQGGWQLTFQNLRFGATATPEGEGN